MKRALFPCAILAAALLACGCDTGNSNNNTTVTDTTTKDTGSTTSSTVSSSDYSASVAATAATYSSADVIANVTFGNTISIDLTALTARLDSGTANDITESGLTLVTDGTTSLIVAKTTYGITITSTLTTVVCYGLTGTYTGTVTVSSAAAYELYLNGVSITAAAGPALDLESSQKAFIDTASGTTNTLTDSSTRSMTMKAAVYCKGPMVFSGSGSLTINGSYKHGIFSGDYIRIAGGTLAVNVSAKDAIRSVNGFIFDDGTLTIKATGTTTDDESKGIKVEGVDSSSGTGKGYIVINGGTIAITSVSKGITASWDIDEDTEDSDSSNNPTPYLTVNNGVISITTTGTPYEYTSGSTTVSCSPEGIESKTDLTINGGYITIATADDCVNAGSSITINDGYLYCMSSANDAIDSNGTMTITGGVIVAGGASAPEGSFDCDQNTFTITGGTFVGIGGASSTPTASSCTQNAVILGSGTAGSTLSIVSSSGTVAFACIIPKSCTAILLSAPAIATGTEYTVYSGGSATGTNCHYGLYLGTLSATGGTAGTSFTVSSTVTSAGTATH